MKRMSSIYNIDEKATTRCSHDNKQIQELYRSYIGQPGGHLAHELLHTTYVDAHAKTVPAYSETEKAEAHGFPVKSSG
jgi:iron only hydrogenase large subunit-like protein